MSITAYKVEAVGHDRTGEDYGYVNIMYRYAYYYLDQEGRALRHFEKALELHPGDDPKLNTRQDMEELIDSCKKGISLPQFWECFRERTENWWETFAEMEAELRQMMDDDKDHTSTRACLKNVNMPNLRVFCPLDGAIFP